MTACLPACFARQPPWRCERCCAVSSLSLPPPVPVAPRVKERFQEHTGWLVWYAPGHRVQFARTGSLLGACWENELMGVGTTLARSRTSARPRTTEYVIMGGGPCRPCPGPTEGNALPSLPPDKRYSHGSLVAQPAPSRLWTEPTRLRIPLCILILGHCRFEGWNLPPP